MHLRECLRGEKLPENGDRIDSARDGALVGYPYVKGYLSGDPNGGKEVEGGQGGDEDEDAPAAGVVPVEPAAVDPDLPGNENTDERTFGRKLGRFKSSPPTGHD